MELVFLKFRKALFLGLAFVVSTTALVAAPESSLGEESACPVIPIPVFYEAKLGQFVLKPSTQVAAETPEAQQVATYFIKEIERATGMSLEVVKTATNNAVILRISKSAEIDSDEGYTLEVTPNAVTITAKAPAGLFYGVQTLRQLMPPEIYSKTPVKEKVTWAVPAVKISDSPRFQWRGAHLDCGRHFFPKRDILKIIDAMSWHKLNRFHWHLTEDQGWRLEIKKYPKLTEIGAWRKGLLVNEDANFVKEDSDCWNSEGLYGGFYSQEDVKEIVDYAKERFITIVPEIEIPGHAVAALNAYPEFSCDGIKPQEIPLRGGVYSKVFCPGKEATFKFWEGVLTEVCDMFPSEYIHLGGDECPKDNWAKCADCQKRIQEEKLYPERGRSAESKLQSYALDRLEKFLETKGKRAIVWDDIMDCGIPDNVAVMHWRDSTDAKIPPRNGKFIVIATYRYCYYDWPYAESDRKLFTTTQGGIRTMKRAYDFDPMPNGLEPEFHKYVLGAQSAYWSEKSPNAQIVEFYLFPRLSAMCESTWSLKERKNWEDFSRRVEIQQQRYKAAGVNARPTVIPPGYKPYKRYGEDESREDDASSN